jgi:dihydroorotate dehydrogenase (NAD+) catalytic subunit
VQRGADALDLLEAGATLVAVGTESFRDPLSASRIVGELTEMLGDHRVEAPSTVR